MKQICFVLLMLNTHCSFTQDSLFFQNAEWSPDGKRICTQVIFRSGSNFFSDGYIINLEERRIERKMPGANFPAWSRNGKYVAYSRHNASPHGSDIWLINTTTGDTALVLNDTSWNSGVSFSPDGKRLCFSSNRNGGYYLYTINADGSDLKRVSFDSVRYFNPSWSPKENKIVYYRERGDQRDKVYVLDLTGKKEIKVTDDSLHNTYPGWLPDGKTINYTVSDLFAKDHVPSQVAFIDVNEQHKSLVTNTGGTFFSRVSPDGKKIALIKGHWPASNIYIANIDGTDPVCITCSLTPD